MALLAFQNELFLEASASLPFCIRDIITSRNLAYKIAPEPANRPVGAVGIQRKCR